MVSPKDKRRQEIARFLKLHKDLGAPAELNAWEQAMWVIMRRHGTKEGASRAMASLQRRYVDVNEVRAAKATEIADVVKRNVKNDAYRVGRQLRGFLWRYHKNLHSIDLASTEALTNMELKKFLSDAEDHAQEMALALYCHYCTVEAAHVAAKAAAEAADEKPKKRPEKDVGQFVDRVRLLCAVAAFGSVPAKAKQATAHRHLAKAWAYSAAPPLPRPAPPPPPKIVIEPPILKPKKAPPRKKAAAKKAPAKKKAVAKKAVAKKTTKKKTVAKKKTTKRGRGTARPRTTRTSRARTTKKSSRR